MNELISAAKAVIAEWDDQQVVGDRNLRAAVERAENAPADYNEWTANNAGKVLSAYEVWTAAQQAMRERIKDLFNQSSDWFEEDQMAQAKWLMEKIDGTAE